MAYNRGRQGIPPLLQNLGRIGGIAGLAIAGIGISNSLFNGIIINTSSVNIL